MLQTRVLAMLAQWQLALIAFLSPCFSTQIALGSPARIEVPITQIRLSSGVRYAVPVRIGGGSKILAMLDTGSVGLRVMAHALASSHYEPTGIERSYGFDGGVQFRGPLVNAVVTIGDVTTARPVPIQNVQAVVCAENRPNCPAARLSPSEYRIGGNGVPNEGFQAILGLSLRKPMVPIAAFNPLSYSGQNSWIVILPLPGEKQSGRLIVNPSRAEQDEFKMIAVPQRQDWSNPPDWQTDGGPNPYSRGPGPSAYDRGPGYLNRGPSAYDRGPGDGVGNRIPVCLNASAPQGTCQPIKVDSGASDGLAVFYTYAVLFDQAHDSIGVRLRSAIPH
jgi:hypothetical protein